MRALRPVLVRVPKEREMPVFNKHYLENLCSEVSLAGLDEDDRAAIVQTMRTVPLHSYRTSWRRGRNWQRSIAQALSGTIAKRHCGRR
jgi:hypothetical protein